MPPAKKVDADSVVEAINTLLQEGQKPYATTTDIAECMDVTDQTIRNNASDLAEDARINKGKVGQSSVYWVDTTTINVSERVYRKHNSRRVDMGLSWDAYLDREYDKVPFVTEDEAYNIAQRAILELF